MQREEVEVAFAWEDDGEESAVGRDGEVAGDATMKDGIEVGLRDRNFVAGGGSGERRDRDPAKFGGFAFRSAFE